MPASSGVSRLLLISCNTAKAHSYNTASTVILTNAFERRVPNHMPDVARSQAQSDVSEGPFVFSHHSCMRSAATILFLRIFRNCKSEGAKPMIAVVPLSTINFDEANRCVLIAALQRLFCRLGHTLLTDCSC